MKCCQHVPRFAMYGFRSKLVRLSKLLKVTDSKIYTSLFQNLSIFRKLGIRNEL
jgi:hypothetical protein